METWLAIIAIPVTAGLTGFFTLRATMTQIKHSEELFDKELKAQIRREERQRRITVRSEPLLKFREELARIAAKRIRVLRLQDNLASAKSPGYKEQLKENLDEAIPDYNDYVSSGAFDHAVYMLDDKEVISQANHIFSSFIDVQLLGLEHLDLVEKEIRGLQQLVNERLEKLGSES